MPGASSHRQLTTHIRYDRADFYRRRGRAGLKLPIISLGLRHNFGAADAFENSRALIRGAFERGITHFDLANNYGPPPGSAEVNFGQILKTDLAGYRDELGLLDVLAHEGIGCIAFSPLAQGLLSERYFHGIPQGSRASGPQGFLPPK